MDASHKTFGIISVRVAPSVVHLLLSHVEMEVDDLDWVVSRMKAESAAELPGKTTGLICLTACSSISFVFFSCFDSFDSASLYILKFLFILETSNLE